MTRALKKVAGMLMGCYSFCRKKLHLHPRVDKIGLCEVDFLVKLTVLFARDGVNKVVKGSTADKKQPLPHKYINR
jgi:hypothetical protein